MLNRPNCIFRKTIFWLLEGAKPTNFHMRQRMIKFY